MAAWARIIPVSLRLPAPMLLWRVPRCSRAAPRRLTRPTFPRSAAPRRWRAAKRSDAPRARAATGLALSSLLWLAAPAAHVGIDHCHHDRQPKCHDGEEAEPGQACVLREYESKQCKQKTGRGEVSGDDKN